MSFLSNRILKARRPILVISSFITLGITVSFAFYTDRIPYVGLYLLCLGLGIFSSAIVVIAFTMTKELFPVQIAGTSTGLVNISPFFGAAVFQPIFGYVLESHGQVNGAFTLAGYQQGFFVLFLCGIVAFVATLFLKETL